MATPTGLRDKHTVPHRWKCPSIYFTSVAFGREDELVGSQDQVVNNDWKGKWMMTELMAGLGCCCSQTRLLQWPPRHHRKEAWVHLDFFSLALCLPTLMTFSLRKVRWHNHSWVKSCLLLPPRHTHKALTLYICSLWEEKGYLLRSQLDGQSTWCIE